MPNMESVLVAAYHLQGPNKGQSLRLFLPEKALHHVRDGLEAVTADVARPGLRLAADGHTEELVAKRRHELLARVHAGGDLDEQARLRHRVHDVTHEGVAVLAGIPILVLALRRPAARRGLGRLVGRDARCAVLEEDVQHVVHYTAAHGGAVDLNVVDLFQDRERRRRPGGPNRRERHGRQGLQVRQRGGGTGRHGQWSEGWRGGLDLNVREELVDLSAWAPTETGASRRRKVDK
ncbi:hypothetical protein ON010_g8873 [Phytophthora cinnamomi]|nr:hypothetical protein ON010_g8873 [Phytophthora cinnamomi]